MNDGLLFILFGAMFLLGTFFGYDAGKSKGRQEGYNRARSIFGAGK